MRMARNFAISLTAAVATLAMPAALWAKANGTPQRSDDPPAGLLKAFEKGTPGLLKAILKTEGTNSRLQDLPQSP